MQEKNIVGFNLILLQFVCYSDLFLTLNAIIKGLWTEGNPLMAYSIDLLGYDLFAISYILIVMALLSSFWIIYINKAELRKLVNYGVIYVLIYRVYILGMWVGIYNSF